MTGEVGYSYPYVTYRTAPKGFTKSIVDRRTVMLKLCLFFFLLGTVIAFNRDLGSVMELSIVIDDVTEQSNLLESSFIDCIIKILTVLCALSLITLYSYLYRIAHYLPLGDDDYIEKRRTGSLRAYRSNRRRGERVKMLGRHKERRGQQER